MAELFAHRNEFLDQLAKTTVFGDLRSGTIYGRSLGDDLGDGLSRTGMSQRVGGAVSWGAFLRTVAVGLAALAEAGGERAGTEIADLSQTSLDLLAFFVESLQGNVHRVLLLSDNTIYCQIEQENCTHTLSNPILHFGVVRPLQTQPLTFFL
jgi:hypothetical protein